MAPRKKDAKELCFRQILTELYTKNKALWEEWKDRKQKKGIRC